MLNLELSLKMAMKMTNKWPVQERGELGGGPGRRQCLYLRLHKWSDFQRS